MKKRSGRLSAVIIRSVTAFFFSCFLCACGKESVQSAISRELGMDVSACEVLSASDSHGGFHGDGTGFYVLDCSDTEVPEQIERAPCWLPFPLDDTVRILVYGIEDERGKTGPYLTDQEGKALIPKIENGYYLLIDRQMEQGMASRVDTRVDILQRGSFNFTLGIYDADTNLLYFCEKDT
ncbi:MAG TPA: hypothetical protein H9761_11450 [Candidatus Eisenbergiella merdavium]|uniref:Lipoprotein n=1 Tax=Candidatus Eisenbergiella merdavium TaxID=2838551 RepID=A0A9D2NHG0_9FIRM|nr:hypothetical protein [Candidatus Eisenbergiella merdavium]